MKKVFFVFGCLFSFMAMAQQINEPFSFPVKPGTKEWSNLRTEEDRFSALQIPDEILTKMSTSALVVSCMNFPLFGLRLLSPPSNTGNELDWYSITGFPIDFQLKFGFQF